MTRTARSTSFRSITKDRSESKTGLDNSIRKNWWRSLSGYNDGQQELDEEDDDSHSGHSEPIGYKKVGSPVLERSEEEIALAKKMRTNAFKNGDVDLATIARTSTAVSGSPPRATVTSDASVSVPKFV
ncbi:hypothetical protein C8J57DRAFT_706796 [Mycena rebaudengoi]|nr:hypothetical protein C8J57DRAFT_706796 [Mycena rebaudengoi]